MQQVQGRRVVTRWWLCYHYICQRLLSGLQDESAGIPVHAAVCIQLTALQLTSNDARQGVQRWVSSCEIYGTIASR